MEHWSAILISCSLQVLSVDKKLTVPGKFTQSSIYFVLYSSWGAIVEALQHRYTQSHEKCLFGAVLLWLLQMQLFFHTFILCFSTLDQDS